MIVGAIYYETLSILNSLDSLTPSNSLLCNHLIENLTLRFVPILQLPIHQLSSFLDPRIKEASGLSSGDAIKLAKDLFGEISPDLFKEADTTCDNATPNAAGSAFLAANLKVKKHTSLLDAEIDTYLALPLVKLSTANDKRPLTIMWSECESAYAFYRNYKANIPLLFELARATFSTPVSAAEIERGFSVASKLGAPDRNFKPKSLKRLIMLNNNYRFSQLV